MELSMLAGGWRMLSIETGGCEEGAPRGVVEARRKVRVPLIERPSRLTLLEGKVSYYSGQMQY
jgi:hypothetical protein